MKPILFEPFRIKVVEPIRMSTQLEREQWIKEAGYNVFALKSDQVMIDLLTDSGTSAMSQEQWAAIMMGDESYAGSRSYFELESAVHDIFGHQIVIPVHQGRAGEHLVFSTLLEPHHIVPSNGHFDTTAANVIDNKATPLNLNIEESKDPFNEHLFKGNMDLEKLEEVLKTKGDHVPFVMLSITNNTCGGQPVSMENAEGVKALCVKYHKQLFIDACRFAENAMFIKKREKGYENWTPLAICQKMLKLAELCTFSAKKDAFANIGGFVCLNDESLAERLRNKLIVTEGFPTYGGLAGRDLGAVAQGLREILDESYLTYRLRTIEWMVERLVQAGLPVLRPSGGHGVYMEGGRFFPNIPAHQFPGVAMVNELYIRAGIRAVELGNVCFGTRDENGNNVFPALDLVRFAMPRRVYTEAHAGYVVESLIELYNNQQGVSGYEFTFEAPVMRHFRSKFKPVQELN